MTARSFAWLRWLVALAVLTGSTAACAKRPSNDAPPPAGGPSARMVYRDAAGRVLTADALAHATGRVDYELIGDGGVSEVARRLFAEGRAAGRSGDYAKAIAVFDRAHEAAPRWPYPVYEAAYSHELMGEPAKALASYEIVAALAPRGFFTAISSADCLRRELAGEWKAGVCKRYLMVEWLEASKRKPALAALLAEAPGLAVAWKDLALATDDDASRLQALDRGLAARPDPETRGLLVINKALVLDRRGGHQQALAMLGDLALDPKAPLDVVELAKLSLLQFVKPP